MKHTITIKSLTRFGRGKLKPFRKRYFRMHFLNGNLSISIKISLKVVPRGRINNIPALDQIMAWRRPGDKPLSEPVLVSLLTHSYKSLRFNELNEILEMMIDVKDTYINSI